MMRCDELSRRQADASRDTGRDDPEFLRHAASCRDCGRALHASRALAADHAARVPVPPDGAFERAMAAVSVRTVDVRRQPVAGFWTGIAIGAAAAITGVFVIPNLLSPSDDPAYEVPAVTLAPDEPQDVSIAIEAVEPMAMAEIHVMLRGAIDLHGYEGQRDVHWTTDLERGVNQLTLPVVVRDARGGAVVVEVHHGGKRKSFHVAVQSVAQGDRA